MAMGDRRKSSSRYLIVFPITKAVSVAALIALPPVGGEGLPTGRSAFQLRRTRSASRVLKRCMRGLQQIDGSLRTAAPYDPQ